MNVRVIIQIDNGGGVLQRAWVYWRVGGQITLLRTNNEGRVLSLRAGTDRNQPWQYTEPFIAATGTQVDLYYSRGALPVPDARLNEHLPIFYPRTIQVTPPNQLPVANVGPVTPNTFTVTPASAITLPPIRFTLVQPRELRLWPVLWELPSDCDLDAACRALAPANKTPDYHTAGLDQGSALRWTQTFPVLPVAENAVAPALPAQVQFQGNALPIRPRERAAHFEGTVDARATGVIVQILNAAGNPVQLRATVDLASPAVNQLNGAVGAVTGTSRVFTADVFFQDAVNTFGPVQLFVRSVGMNPPIVEAFEGYLCGFQIDLVDDFASNADGTQRGPFLNESHDRLNVDFQNSPQNARPAMRAQTRVRRMPTFTLNHRQRLLDPTAAAGPQNPNIYRPEMPMWMAEFQAVGVSDVSATNFLQLRARVEGAPFDLTLETNWTLDLVWDGPDHAADPNLAYQYNLTFPQRQTVSMRFGNNGQFVDAAGANVTLSNGQLPNAITPAPVAVPFPVTGRRLPGVFVTGQQRAWGRTAAAVSKDAWVIECQLRVTRLPNPPEVESIRGGDGSLRLELSVDTVDVIRPTIEHPAMRLPRLRTRGQNPTPREIADIRDAVVDEYVRVHAGDAWVQRLPASTWRETARLVFAHESGGDHFDSRNSQIRFLGDPFRLYYGNENGMPFFGGPHGYGLVQVDYNINPVPGAVPTLDQLHDELWNIVDAIRGGVHHLIHEKGRAAHNHLNAHNLTDVRRMRAIFQRETVRRYNGGSEFRWNGTDWEIHPSLGRWVSSAHHSRGANPRLTYPNNVLNTRVTYSTGDGVANRIIEVTPMDTAASDLAAGTRTVFAWPIQFVAADFGPGIPP